MFANYNYYYKKLKYKRKLAAENMKLDSNFSHL